MTSYLNDRSSQGTGSPGGSLWRFARAPVARNAKPRLSALGCQVDRGTFVARFSPPLTSYCPAAPSSQFGSFWPDHTTAKLSQKESHELPSLQIWRRVEHQASSLDERPDPLRIHLPPPTSHVDHQARICPSQDSGVDSLHQKNSWLRLLHMPIAVPIHVRHVCG